MTGNSLYLKKNVGTVDRVFRLILGFLLIVLPVYLSWSPWAAVVAAAFGGSFIFEGITAY